MIILRALWWDPHIQALSIHAHRDKQITVRHQQELLHKGKQTRYTNAQGNRAEWRREEDTTPFLASPLHEARCKIYIYIYIYISESSEFDFALKSNYQISFYHYRLSVHLLHSVFCLDFCSTLTFWPLWPNPQLAQSGMEPVKQAQWQVSKQSGCILNLKTQRNKLAAMLSYFLNWTLFASVKQANRLKSPSRNHRARM